MWRSALHVRQEGAIGEQRGSLINISLILDSCYAAHTLVHQEVVKQGNARQQLAFETGRLALQETSSVTVSLGW